MAIAWIILAQFVCVQLAAGACQDGKTGPRCTYDCHCNLPPRCDESSNCSGSCVNGWRGWTCQQGNVALGKPTDSSPTRNGSGPGRAVDGIMGTETEEFHTAVSGPPASSVWWSVDLQNTTSVQEVVIYFRTDYTVRRNGVNLYYSTTNPTGTNPPMWRTHCYTVQGNPKGTNINDTLSVPECRGIWRYLFIYTETDNSQTNVGPVLDFKEIEVYACARGTYGSDCSQFCDGCNSDGCDSSGQCHSGCRPGKVTSEQCTKDCPIGRYGAGCASVCSDRGCVTSSDSCNAETGVCLSGCKSNGFSTLDCSVCRTGWYGDSCDKQCNLRQCAMLQQNSICDRTRVACPTGGCKPGYTGSDCATVCLKSYGENCSNSCNSRHCADNSSICPHITGACVPEECKPGYLGTDCQQVCTTGTYGRGCVLSCGERKCFVSSSSCDHVTGQCDGGCMAGWNGSDCTQECPAGTYGPNCSKLCSDRKCKTESDNCSQTGVCPRGCKPGWKEEDCSIHCPHGTFGLTCVSCNTRHCQVENDCSGDGTCPGECQDGWTLDNCTQACPGGTYGPRCSFTCGNCSVGDICNHESGLCPGNCIAGWEGSRCQQRTTSPTANIMPAVVGAVAGVLIVVIIIIIVFILYRRRHNPSSKKAKQTGSSDSPSPESLNGGNMYVNVAYVENEAAIEKKEKPPLLKKPKSANKPNKAPPEILNPEQEEEIVEEDKPSSQKGEYYNLGEDVIREVPVAELADTIQKIKHRKGGFEAEYDRLPIGFTALYDDSQKPENAGKNKFRGYYPYDHNRVRLTLIQNIPGSDYINASLMHSYDQKKTYIAAQAPNKKTVGDFWRMIWEHRCNRVIMLTGLVEAAKVKCYKYWPDCDALETDQHKVEVEVTDIRANYTIRHLKVTSKDGECRPIVQYHFTSWPDHGVPDTLALVHFIWMIRRTDTQTDGPLLVHCSAGIGRTGTYIAVDSLLDQARAEGMVNVHGYVSVMRGQRKNMIQTKEQYECVFHCLLDMTTFGNTSMDVGTFAASYSSRGMDSMVDRKTIRGLTQMATTEERCDQPDRHKMWVDGNHDYTVRVGPTLRNVRGYLQSNAPPSGQEKLLWKLVEQNDVHNVVAISPLQVTLFGEKGTTMTYGDVTLKTTDMTSLTSDITMATLQLHVTDGGTFQNVKLFKFSGSPSMDSMSSHLLDQADLQHLSLELSRVVLIHSESDRKFAILFCIMGNILSGMMEDRRVDVIGHVRTFLKCCPDVTFTEQDVEKLHVFAQKCVQMTDTSNTYANL